MADLSTPDITRFIGRYSIGRDGNPLDNRGSLHFLRIKVPGGLLTADQLRGIADLAGRYGRGRGEITDRQDIQLHWIEAEDSLTIFSEMERMGFTTDMCGQGFGGPRYGDVRNIVCCPASGIEKREFIDVHPLMKKLSSFFIGNSAFQDMPRKFKFTLSGCGSNCVRAEANDVCFAAVERDGEVGFTMLIGGGVGASLPGPRLAQKTSLFIRPEEAYEVAVASVEVHRDKSSRESKAKARFKWLIHELGIEKFRNILEEKVGRPLETYEGPPFPENGDHHGIKPQRQGGYYYVNIPLIGGVLKNGEMTSLADIAEEYGDGELRLTPQQNIIIPNVKDKEEVVKKLERSGFTLRGSSLRWNSMGCTSDFCGKTRELHAKEVVEDIINHLESRFPLEFLDEAALNIYASGCPNNCCANLLAGIGLEGRLLKEGGEMTQYYRILVGGRGGSHPRIAQLLWDKTPSYKLKYQIENLLDHYRRERRGKESFYEFCHRMPLEKLRSSFSHGDE